MSILLESLKLNPSQFLIGNKIVLLKGVDACSYLHSQTTNDLLSLNENGFQFNSILDIAGKIISSFIVCKKSNSEIYLIVPKDFVQNTFERIEKYHIAEDFEVEVMDKNVVLKTHSTTGEFSGSFFFENDVINFSDEYDFDQNSVQFQQLKVLSGVPVLGEEVQPNTLINNTFFDELSVDYKKGCFPGQETVSKINTRRGAAFKPVLVVLDQTQFFAKDKILKDGKKIGEILNSISIDGKTYIMVNLGREYRIEDLKLDFEYNEEKFNGLVKYYPFLPRTNSEMAIELYDHAMDCFHEESYDKAIDYFKLAISKNPSYEDAYESLGVLYGRLENYQMAIELMEKLKEINPKCMMAFTNLSLYHMKIGNIETAEDFKSQATLLNFQVLGDEAERKRLEEEALKKKQAEQLKRESMFKQVIELDAEDAMANNGMGEIELERKNYSSAEAFFRMAIKGNKKYSVAYLGLGKSLYFQNILEEAKTILTEGISIASKNGDLMPANEMQALLVKLNR